MGPSVMGPRWYAARTEPRADSVAAREFSRDGFEVYAPRVKALQLPAGHPDTPLFPGYLFVRIDPDGDGWPSLRPAHRIVGWVTFGSETAWLPDQVIDELKERVNAINGEGGLWQRFQRGQKVHVVTHSIDSLAEVIEEASSPQGRAKVLMEFMGRLVQAEVPWQNLRSVQTATVEVHRVPRRTRGGGRWVRGFEPTDDTAS